MITLLLSLLYGKHYYLSTFSKADISNFRILDSLYARLNNYMTLKNWTERLMYLGPLYAPLMATSSTASYENIVKWRYCLWSCHLIISDVANGFHRKWIHSRFSVWNSLRMCFVSWQIVYVLVHGVLTVMQYRYTCEKRQNVAGLAGLP